MNIRLKLYCIYIINKKKLYSSCVLFLEPLGTMLCLKKKILFMNKDNALKKKKEEEEEDGRGGLYPSLTFGTKTSLLQSVQI